MSDTDQVDIVLVFYHAAIRALCARKPNANHGNMEWPRVGRAGLNAETMTILPLTEMIGFPLKFKAALLNPSFHNFVREYRGHRRGPPLLERFELNLTLSRLSTITDPSSARLGFPEHEAYCEVMLARVDGEDLHPAHVYALDLFIEERFANLFRLAEEKDFDGAKAEIEKVMNDLPKAFAIFCKTLRAEKILERKDTKWIPIKCPVRLKTPTCENCDSEKSEDGSLLLLLCGKCKSTAYCSKKCQRDDWKLHKIICGSG